MATDPRHADPPPTWRRPIDIDGPLDCAEWAASGAGAHLAPLVLLHEGLGSLDLWRGLPGRLAGMTGRRTLAYSRHGYGRSAVVRDPRGVDYMHREGQVVLPRLLAHLGYADPVLVGHSDGASIAVIAAGTGSLAPRGMALLAPHVIVEDVSIAGIAAAREAYDTGDLATRLARHHDDADATFRGWNDIWLSPAFRDWDLTGLLGGVTCPLLLIQGLEDQYGTLSQLDLIADGVSGTVRRVELAGCRHSPHLDAPDATTAAIAAFLTAIG